MSTHRHIIQVGEFEIKLTDEASAISIFDTIKRLNSGPITNLIEKYCDSYCAEQETHRIEKLELDLGTIPSSSFEKIFLTRFEKELAGALKSAIKKDTANSERLIQQADRDMELFEFYLNNGALPWWANSKESGVLKDALTRLLNNMANQLKHVLFSLLQKPNVRKRLATINSVPGFNEIAELLSDQTILLHEELLSAIASWRGISKIKITTLLREIFLKTVGTKQHDLPLNFFQNIAADMGQTIDELINGIEKSLTTTQKNAQGVNIADASRFPQGNIVTGNEMDQSRSGKVSPNELMVLLNKIRTLLHEQRMKRTNSIDNIQTKPGSTEQNETSDHKQKSTLPEKMINKSVNLKHSESEELYLDNAGIVLLGPYLPRFFRALGFVENNDWLDSEARQKGVATLHFLINGLTKMEEYQTPFLKVLCGLLPDEPLEELELLSDETQSECINLLESVIANATVLGSLSVDGFRGSYLLRPGLLTTRDGNWLVQVERRSYDLLLDKLPWAFKMIKLPWLKQFIVTEW